MTANATTSLMLIRHGETEWNRQERFQGHGDSVLTGLGRCQAAEMGKRLQTWDFQKLISSDLGRAVETARIIATHTGHKVETDRLIRERNYGVLEGLTIPEIKKRHPAVLERLKQDDPDFIVPEGESHWQHYSRNARFFGRCLEAFAGMRIALVVHGGVLDSAFRFVTGIKPGKPRCFIVPNTSLSVISHGIFYGTLRWVIETWGDVGHLEGIVSGERL